MTLEEYKGFLEGLAEKNCKKIAPQTDNKNILVAKRLKKKRFTKTKNTNYAKRRF